MAPPIVETKKERLFRKMEKVNDRASNAWGRLRRVESRWDALKEKLEKAGVWKEFCDTHHWHHEANFSDMGA